MIGNVLHIGNVEGIAVGRARAGGTTGIRRSCVRAGAAAAAVELNFMANVLRQFIGVAGELKGGSGLVLGQGVVAGRAVQAALDRSCTCGAVALIAGVGAAGVGICALTRRAALARTGTRALVRARRRTARTGRTLSERHCRGQQQSQHHQYCFFHACSSEINTPRGVVVTRLECEVQGIRLIRQSIPLGGLPKPERTQQKPGNRNSEYVGRSMFCSGSVTSKVAVQS